MRTIGRSISPDQTGETIARCSICGAMWYRSKLRRIRGGSLVCPDEGRGREAPELARASGRTRRPRRART